MRTKSAKIDSLLSQNRPVVISDNPTGATQTPQTDLPLNALPYEVQEIINGFTDGRKYPKEFCFSSILWGFSTAIGKLYRYDFLGYSGFCPLYVCNVTDSGTGKTAPMKDATNPFRIENERLRETFEAQQNEGTAPDRPPRALIKTATPESLIPLLSIRERGMGMYANEIARWLNGFDQYSKGGELDTYLEFWESETGTRDTKAEFLDYKEPFLSILGSIQTSRISLFKDKDENGSGFLPRFLFTILEDVKRPYKSEIGLNPNVPQNYQRLISYFLTQDFIEPKILKPTPQALKTLKSWDVETTDLYNNEGNHKLKEMYAKMDTYLGRFCIILEGMKASCNNTPPSEISESTVLGAIQIAKYFINQAQKVYTHLFNPVDTLAPKYKKLYEKLPKTDFRRGDAIKIGGRQSPKISDRSIDDFLKNEQFFEKLDTGIYRKK